MEAKLTQMTQPQSLSESACTAQFRIRLQRMLKGTVSQEILTNFFCLKDSTWATYEQAETVSQTFLFSRRYSRKTCVPVVVNDAGTGVSVVVDYADMVLV